MPRQKDLNSRQKKFCRLYVQGETAGNIAQSHRKAGYVCPTIEGHGGNGLRLLRSERIQKEIARIRDNQFKKDCLSYNEKRSWLARAVRSDARSADPDLVQEVREEVDKEGNVKRLVKLVSKMDALREDNVMAGDRFQDREPQANNAFSLLVQVSRLASMAQANQAKLPEGEKAIEAEVIEVETQEKGEE
jgi:phage terminase small subunit